MKYFLGMFTVMTLLVIAIVFVVSGRNRNSGTQAGVTRNIVNLLDFVDNNSARLKYSIDGKVEATENRTNLEISVSKTQRTVTITKGYNGEVVKTQSYPNDRASFERFLRVMQTAGFTSELTNGNYKNTDERSVCARGVRYIYELIEGDSVKSHLWNTSCSVKQGTFGGSTSAKTIIQDQIPDLSDFIRGYSFR